MRRFRSSKRRATRSIATSPVRASSEVLGGPKPDCAKPDCAKPDEAVYATRDEAAISRIARRSESDESTP